MNRSVLTMAVLWFGVGAAGQAVAGPGGASQHGGMCRDIHWEPGEIIAIQSSMNVGTRVDLPADLVTDPVPGNKELWNVEGAADQVLIKPNSDAPQGQKTVVRAFTKDGNSFDIVAQRVENGGDDICVSVRLDGQMISDEARSALEGVSRNRQLAMASVAGAQQTEAMRQAMLRQAESADEDKRKAVMEALRRFRYHVYTRYDWEQGSSFETKGLVSDVYDDGRFTYIRLNSPNRGLLSIESEVGGKTAIVPAKYDDAYGMYQINGIYPSFTLRLDDAKLEVSRADSVTKGAF